MDNEALDLTIFNTFKLIMGNNFQPIMLTYIHVSKQYVDTIQQLCESAEFGALADVAHALKSSSMQIGAIKVGEIAAQLERNGHHIKPNHTKIDSLVQQLQQAQADVMQQLRGLELA